MEVRLQKVIAASGLASRRKAEQLIAQGRVTVNGQIIRELGSRVDPDQDHVKVDGRHLRAVEPHAYVILNKPKGYVSSLSDPEGRPTIKDLLHGVPFRVFPVGRLDFDTEGVLLLTNHGEMAQALLHPRYHVPKVYLVKVKGVLSDDEIRQLEEGVRLEDGLTGPAVVKKIKKAEENSWIELTIHEGRKHQVKRMLEAVGHPVLKLKRLKFGPLMLGDLPSGEFRYLTDREANALRSVFKNRESYVRQSASESSRSANTTDRSQRSPSFTRPRTGGDQGISRQPRPSGLGPGRRSADRTRPSDAGQERRLVDRTRPPDAGRDRRVVNYTRPPDAGQDRRSADRTRPPAAGQDRRFSQGTRPFRRLPDAPTRSRSRPPDTGQVRRSAEGPRSRGTRFVPSTPGRPRRHRAGAPPGVADRRRSRGPRSVSGRSRPPGRGKSSRSPIGSRPRGRRRP